MSRRNPSTPVTPPQVPSQSSHPAATDWNPPTESNYDKFMTLQNPNHKPASRMEIVGMLFSMGATWDTLDHCWEMFNAGWAAKLQNPPNSIAKKPDTGDPSVLYVDIPDTPYSVRIWDGGLTGYGQFCLDYFNKERNVAINAPAGFAIRPVPHASPPGTFAFGGPLVPWEQTLGFMIPAGTPRPAEGPGTERFSAPENAVLEVTRDNRPCVAFQVPRRNPVSLANLVQPMPRAY